MLCFIMHYYSIIFNIITIMVLIIVESNGDGDNGVDC